MSDKERFELHALNLGKLVGNLQALEMAARMVIVKLDPSAAKQVQTQLPQVKVGDFVEDNAFTNKDGLTPTLKKYNKRVAAKYRIDVEPIVRLRDALAHGRTFGFGAIRSLRLLKFSRKKSASGKIEVELAEDMTRQWFVTNIRLLESALEKVRKALDYEKRELA